MQNGARFDLTPFAELSDDLSAMRFSCSTINFWAFTLFTTFLLALEAVAQTSPLIRELQREVGAAYAQDVAAQGNARAAAEDQHNSAALAEILTRTPKSGYEVYLQFRFGQEPGERRWANGSKNWYVRPWNDVERVQKLGQYRQEYAAFGAAERARWEAKANNADLAVNAPPQPLPTTLPPQPSAPAGAFGSNDLLEQMRQHKRAAAAAVAPPGPVPVSPQAGALTEAQKDEIRRDSGRRAVAVYPDTANPNSALVKRMFVLDDALRQAADPLYFSPDKPFQLAQRAARELGIPPRP